MSRFVGRPHGTRDTTVDTHMDTHRTQSSGVAGGELPVRVGGEFTVAFSAALGGSSIFEIL